MPRLRVLLDFADGSDLVLVERSGAVLELLYSVEGVIAYPEPPVTAVELGNARTAFINALSTAETDGPGAVADKNEKRTVLVALLYKLADYVQTKHGNNLATLLKSGFLAASTSNTSSPLDKPIIREVVNNDIGQFIVKVKKVKNAKSYELILRLMAENGELGPPQSGGVHTDTRKMLVTGLIPGGNYQIMARAVGGSDGYSPWSDAVVRRCL
jgi:hypothetical protein